jgi:hypothetical protein
MRLPCDSSLHKKTVVEQGRLVYSLTTIVYASRVVRDFLEAVVKQIIIAAILAALTLFLQYR